MGIFGPSVAAVWTNSVRERRAESKRKLHESVSVVLERFFQVWRSYDSWSLFFVLVPVAWCIFPTFESSRATEMLDECQCSMSHFIKIETTLCVSVSTLQNSVLVVSLCDLKTKERSRSSEPISFCGCSVWLESSVPASSHHTPTVPGIPSTI